MKKQFTFTIDDNIWFLREVTNGEYPSLFSHPYSRSLKELHEQFGVKIQLNLFYQDSLFTLAEMTEKYKDEWEQNADWLKLSFHSLLENRYPYENSDYQEVYGDCQKVQNEILRFAGKNSLAKTTTVHCCRTTEEGVRALVDCGVKGLLGLFGEDEETRTSYALPEVFAERLRRGEIVCVNEVTFAKIDVILNLFDIPSILEQLRDLRDRNVIRVMIHEQFFYPDYVRYQPNFKEKLEATFSYLQECGFSSCFFEDIIER